MQSIIDEFSDEIAVWVPFIILVFLVFCFASISKLVRNDSSCNGKYCQEQVLSLGNFPTDH